MIRRLKAGLVIAAAAALLVPFVPMDAEAQVSGRFRVIIPDVVPTDGSDPHFGNRVSGYLRDMIDLPTHVAMPASEIDERAQEFDVRYEDLDCGLAFQLATQIQGQLVMCGEYHEENGEYLVDVTFMTVPDGDELPVAPFTMPQDEWVAAAEHLSDEFEQIVEGQRVISRCDEALRNQSWNEAIDLCGEAVDYVPDSYLVRRALGNAYLQTEQWAESLENYEMILEERPNDQEILESAGWVAGQVGDTDAARDYYTRYLELNPENVSIRIQVAYDLAETGDNYGAMRLLEEGLEQEPENIDLLDRYGTYAFRAAVELQQEQGDGDVVAEGEPEEAPELGSDPDAPDLDAEVEELYREAIGAYEVVLTEAGDEARVGQATNTMRAYRQLGEYDEAVRVGQMARDLFPDDAGLEAQLAAAHNDAGDVDSAIAALDRALEIDPDYPQGRMRRGIYLLDAGRVDEAVQALQVAAEAGEENPNQLGMIVFGYGYNNYVQQGEYQEGIRLIEAAKQFDLSTETREQLDFFHGYSLYEYGRAVEEPQTLQSAQSALQIFQQSREFVQAGRGYADRAPNISAEEILEAIEAYVEIQEAVIAREGRR